MIADVVISTRNNISQKNFSIQYVIRSLLHQAADDLNIIVADNGSDDGTAEGIKKLFGQRVGIIDTSEVAGNISASRNLAANCGKLETILFLDDDMIPSTADTLGKCLNIGQKVDFACGAIRKWSPLLWSDLIRPDDPILKIVSTLEHTSKEPLSINRISGKNILDNRSYLANFGTIRRSVFNSLGGYDEDYSGWGYQDTDLMWRLCVAGKEYDLFSRYDLVVFHLSHAVNKGSKYEINRQRFINKQKQDGRLFHTNHFFEVYENDGYSLFSDFPELSIS